MLNSFSISGLTDLAEKQTLKQADAIGSGRQQNQIWIVLAFTTPYNKGNNGRYYQSYQYDSPYHACFKNTANYATAG